MDRVVNNENTFTYKYSATENKEILDIRRKYLPKSESKSEELKQPGKEVIGKNFRTNRRVVSGIKIARGQKTSR